MRTDHAAEVIEELTALAEEHDRHTEEIWSRMVRVAVIENRQTVLIDRLNDIRHGVVVAEAT